MGEGWGGGWGKGREGGGNGGVAFDLFWLVFGPFGSFLDLVITLLFWTIFKMQTNSRIYK